MMEPRTYLFVPGNRPDRFAKALASGADAVVIDLEDAVAIAAKGEARDAIALWSKEAVAEDRARVVVRINDAASNAFAEDLRSMREARLARVMLPKAESAVQIEGVRSALGEARVLALVESARGAAMAHEIAAAQGVERLVFGTLDYALDLDLEIDENAEGLSHAAGLIAIASRLAGLPAPVAGVTPRIDDERRLHEDVRWARRHGFGAKLCIHPRQVAPIHEALAPSAKSLEWARRVLEAEAASPGVAQLDGRMVDRPVVLLAQRTLQRAGR